MAQSSTALQTATGHPLMAEDPCPIDPAEAADRLMAGVGRSWCEGRTMIAARTVLTLVPEAERRRLVSDYVKRGGGLAMFQPSEKDAFLAFLAARLPYPSHALTLCHMAQALARAQAGAEPFVEPGIRTIRARVDGTLRDRIEHEAWRCIDLGVPGRAEPEVREHIARELRRRIEREAWQCIARAAQGRITRGQHAALVWFHADPEAVLWVLHGAPVPPVGEPAYPLLFAPGLTNLWRPATTEEAALWSSLPVDNLAPELTDRLLAEGAVTYTD